MGISKKNGTPKSSHFNRVFHEINRPFWGKTHYFWKQPNVYNNILGFILQQAPEQNGWEIPAKSIERYV